MKTVVIFVDNYAAQIETYEESQLTSRKTVKALSAMIWMHKTGKDWTWSYTEDGYEKAEAE